MNQVKATGILAEWDRKGVCLFSRADLGKLFDEEGSTLSSTIGRMLSNSALTRISRGLFFNPRATQLGENFIEKIALRLRRGEYCYVSLESAASQWGVISQIPISRLTVMTTGREGEFHTPFGTIEFVHTKVSPEEILANTVEWPGHPMRYATKQRAVRDLRVCHRSEDLIDWSEVHDDGN